MGSDRSYRLLTSLVSAPSNRVLNLAGIAAAMGGASEHEDRPFFSSKTLNSAIILKHRVRSDESYLFEEERNLATKIIVPFDMNDLRMGGQSFFVAQRGYRDMLRDIGKYKEGDIERDLGILNVIDTIPSLDPFLLREQLRANGISVGQCYFGISESDQEKMHDIVYQEIKPLAMIAGGNSSTSRSTERLVAALLSNQMSDKLEPLRETLGMSSEEFRKGVFGWRGFLYYKWCMLDLWPDVKKVMGEIRNTAPIGMSDAEQRRYIDASQREVLRNVHEYGRAITTAINVYDDAYRDLVGNMRPKPFRDFLLRAPDLFISLGERMGAITHIVNFWRHRFPEGRYPSVSIDELIAIYQDFGAGFRKLDIDEAA